MPVDTRYTRTATIRPHMRSDGQIRHYVEVLTYAQNGSLVGSDAVSSATVELAHEWIARHYSTATIIPYRKES